MSKKAKVVKEKKKNHLGGKIFLGIVAILVAVGCVFSYFGGFSTGKTADVAEFAKYAGQVSDITIPEETRIIALGEATHGNSEFQQLKLDVFKVMVEKYGVRGFALEADYGCCEKANRFIHGGDGTAKEAAAALGFQIYRTEEIAQLLSWMREYNEGAAEGESITFYGFDMQRYENNYTYLIETAKALGANTAELEKVWSNGELSDDYTGEQREEIINAVKAELSAMENAQTAQAIQFADVLLQNIELGRSISDPNLVTSLRDKLMAQNVMWILGQEEARGNSRIFISAHNGHMEQEGYYDTENKVMGTILEHEIGEEAYFAIGTDFYKTKNNMPNGKNGRTTLTVFSTDPLANAAKKCGYDTCWLDFSEVPEDSALSPQITDYCYMGSLGENQMNFLGKAIMRAVPYTYRVWRSPSTTYDGMIFVTNAHPITVED